MVTLKHPFDGESLHFLAMKILRGEPPAPDPSFSQDLTNLITVMLKKKMELRPKLADILSYDFLLPTVDHVMDAFQIPAYVPPPAHTPRKNIVPNVLAF